MIKQAVILVGGKGSRLGELTKKTPKPLLDINGTRFLDILIQQLIPLNFQTIFLCAGYKGSKIKNLYHNKNFFLSKIKVIIEKKPLDTGGSIAQLKNKINSDFLLINGDSYLDTNFYELINKKNYKIKNPKIGQMFLIKNYNYKSNSKLSNLKLIQNNIVQLAKNSNFMNSGVYIFKKTIFNYLKKKPSSLENDVLTNLILKKKIYGKKIKNKIFDIGTPKNLVNFKKYYKRITNSRKCMFLDRDGVINEHSGYVTKYKQFKVKPKILKIIKKLNKRKILIIVITNQSAIARGMMTEEDLKYIHYKFLLELNLNYNSFVNNLYYCPYLKNAKIKKYRKISNLRKPNPGMLLKALKYYSLNKKNCIFIGDQKSDKIASSKANIKFYHIKNIKNAISEINN